MTFDNLIFKTLDIRGKLEKKLFSQKSKIHACPCFLGTWMNAGSTFLKYRSILKEEAIEYILVIGSKRDGRPIKMDSEREKKRKP